MLRHHVANTAKGLTSNTTRPSASLDPQERVVRISINDGKAEVYRGEEALGTTPYPYHGKLGEHVSLTLRREGYQDTPAEFVVGEKKEYMYEMKKK